MLSSIGEGDGILVDMGRGGSLLRISVYGPFGDSPDGLLSTSPVIIREEVAGWFGKLSA